MKLSFYSGVMRHSEAANDYDADTTHWKQGGHSSAYAVDNVQ